MSPRAAILVLILTAVLLTAFQVVVVPTASMEGTVLTGDHLLINRLPFGPKLPFISIRLPRWGSIRHGDLVSFHPPNGSRQVYLKRVVARGGDEVLIRDNTLYVNAVQVEEPYVRRMAGLSSMPNVQTVVPPGELFVLGDNRDASEDSRNFGTVPEKNVIGKPVIVLWSFRFTTQQWSSNSPLALYFKRPLAHLRWDRLLHPLR